MEKNATECEEFPCFLYIYDANGFHNGKVVIETEAELLEAFKGPIKKAMNEKRQVRIADLLDSLMFHAEDGKIIFPTKAMYEANQRSKANG